MYKAKDISLKKILKDFKKSIERIAYNFEVLLMGGYTFRTFSHWEKQILLSKENVSRNKRNHRIDYSVLRKRTSNYLFLSPTFSIHIHHLNSLPAIKWVNLLINNINLEPCDDGYQETGMQGKVQCHCG